MNNLIFIVEDDENIRALIEASLKSANFFVKSYENGSLLFDSLKKEIPALIILDIMLPDENGLDILKKLRNKSEFAKIPVIFLTAKSSELDKVNGLDLGADDFIVKPFGILELISRVKAVLRRYSVLNLEEPRDIIFYKDLKINKSEKAIYKNDLKLNLTFKEYELFLYLYSHRGITISREKLLDKVWDYNFQGETRTVDSHIRSLRSKLFDNKDAPNYIETVRGFGYLLIK